MFKEIHDAKTRITTQVEMTAEEIAEIEAIQLKSIKQQQDITAKYNEKLKQRQDILDRLGISSEEAKILLGGN